MIRLSVTDLDGFLYWRESEQDLSALVSRLRGQVEPTPQMLAGRAFHKLFETAEPGEILTHEVDGFRFDFAIDSAIALPSIRELKGEVVFDTPAGPVTLVGKVDAMNGTTIIDYKLTERFDAERYADSYQWRAYLTMFGGQVFHYETFVCRYDGPRVTVYDNHPIRFYAYPSMRDDVRRLVGELAEIVVKHVPEKVALEAA